MNHALAFLVGLAIGTFCIWAGLYYQNHFLPSPEPEVQLLTDLQYWDEEFKELVGKDVREFLEPAAYALLVEAQQKQSVYWAGIAQSRCNPAYLGAGLQNTLTAQGLGAPIRIASNYINVWEGKW